MQDEYTIGEQSTLRSAKYETSEVILGTNIWYLNQNTVKNTIRTYKEYMKNIELWGWAGKESHDPMTPGQVMCAHL